MLVGLRIWHEAPRCCAPPADGAFASFGDDSACAAVVFCGRYSGTCYTRPGYGSAGGEVFASCCLGDARVCSVRGREAVYTGARVLFGWDVRVADMYAD